MYAKEVRGNRSKNHLDSPAARLSPLKQSNSKRHSDDDFMLNYGNYGDPHSFAPYQLILLFTDFVFNWTLDLTHEVPLAVLVIFVFQSLAIIINLILYIMSSASQAMQVGVKRHVNVHHWCNLIICLLYMSLTGWWFVWALRKSWPSVSDQFSFSWPNSNLETQQGNITLKGNGTGNATRATYSDSPAVMKEHYTLWSPGFNALYVVHRTVAILYYFFYMRSSFLVLNTPQIENFLEKKKRYLDKVQQKMNKSESVKTISSGHDFVRPPSSALDLDKYLDSAFSLDNEFRRKHKAVKKIQRATESKIETEIKGKRRQIIWADEEQIDDRFHEKPKAVKSRRHKKDATEEKHTAIVSDEPPEEDPHPEKRKRKSKGNNHSRHHQDSNGIQTAGDDGVKNDEN